jgi:hypothetical protein
MTFEPTSSNDLLAAVNVAFENLCATSGPSRRVGLWINWCHEFSGFSGDFLSQVVDLRDNQSARYYKGVELAWRNTFPAEVES